MTQPTHDELKSLIAPYALGAVPHDEDAMVRAHLLTCDECRAEVEAFSEVTARLALAAQPSELPRGFADRVVRQVHDERHKHVAPQSRSRIAAVFAVAVLVLATATLSFFLATTRQDLSEERSLVSSLLRREEGLRLNGNGAVAAVLPKKSGSVFVVDGLDDAPDNKTYQLWLLQEGQDPVSAGTFDVRDGRAILNSDENLEGFAGAAVTVEPEGGSPAPTTEPVMAS